MGTKEPLCTEDGTQGKHGRAWPGRCELTTQWAFQGGKEPRVSRPRPEGCRLWAPDAAFSPPGRPKTRVVVSYHTSSYEAFLDFLHSPARAPEPGHNEMVVPSPLNPRQSPRATPASDRGAHRTMSPRRQAPAGPSPPEPRRRRHPGRLRAPLRTPKCQFGHSSQPPQAKTCSNSSWESNVATQSPGLSLASRDCPHVRSTELWGQPPAGQTEEWQRRGLCSCPTANAEDLWTADHPTLSLTLA